MKKRLLSTLLILVMVFSVLSVTAFADGNVVEVADKTALTSAINTATNGATIQLTQDITSDAVLLIDKPITLDLGGNTLTTTNGWGGLQLKNGCSVKNGTLVHTGRVNAIKVWDVVSIEDLVIEVTDTTEGKTVGGIAIQENAAGVDEINNVTMQGAGLDYGIETYNCGNATEPVIGSMENVTIDAVGTGMLISAPCGTATGCDIKGGVSGIEIWIKGTYSASLDLDDCKVEGGEQAVYAHDEFNSNPITNIGTIKLKADDETEFNSDNGVPLTLTIARVNEETQVDLPEKLTENLVAKANGTYYGSLADAVAAANAVEGGATVELLKNVTLGEKLTVSDNVTITGAYTITRADEYPGTLFEVNTDATLTLDGGLTIDGGNEWVFDETGYEAALADKSKNQDFAFVTAEEGAPVATADMFTVNGAVVMNKATIQNHMGNSSCNVFGANANSSLTLNDGAVIKHNATPFESTVIAMSAGSTFTINEGAEISGNYAGRNGGVSRNNNGTIVMNGGEIINNYSVNTNGTVFMLYGADSMFEMNDGLICGNTGTNGPQNGRNAAIYGHTGSKMVMIGGSICHNTGISYGGVDAPYTGTSGNASSFEIQGGYIGENVSVIGNTNADVNGGSRLTISGGTFTQDVSEWCVPGYKADDPDGDGIWEIVKDPDQYVVEMDGVKYLTIKDALDTLKSADTETHTLTVLKDHEIDVNYHTYNYPILVNGFSVILDLNGKTITADWGKYTATTTRYDNALIAVCNGGKLTVIDSSKEKTGKIVNNDDRTDEPNETVAAQNRIFWIQNSVENKPVIVNIEGGTFVQNDNSHLLYIQGDRTTPEGGGVTVNINGGHFEQNAISENGNYDFFNAYDGYKYTATIYGGTFNHNPGNYEIVLADGYMAIENDDGIWAVARKECIVTFDSNGGSAVDAQTIVYGEDAELQKASKPDDPVKSGYTFLGWYLNDEEYDFDTVVTDSITLTAKWEKAFVHIPTAPVKPVEKDEPCDGGKDCPAFLLSDVDTDAWYHEAIDFALAEGLMNGVGGGKFNPGGNFTRAMMWTVLARQAGVDTDGGETWYSVAQEWAIANDVSDGTNPDGAITREQLVTMLWRYVGEPEGKADLSDFVDGDDVSEWAEEAMRWAVAVKVISGRGSGILAPQGLATRAEVAQIFKNYFE